MKVELDDSTQNHNTGRASFDITSTDLNGSILREKPHCVKVIPKLEQKSMKTLKTERKPRRPWIVDDTPSKPIDESIFKQAEILHENFRTEDLSEDMWSPAKKHKIINGEKELITPLKTVNLSLNSEKSYSKYLTKSKKKVSIFYDQK